MKRTIKPKKKTIAVSARKAKGRKLQQWVCQQISDLTGYEWGSSGDDCTIESRPMGQKGVDVRLESQVQEQFLFSVECKSQETWSISTWIKQAKENQSVGTDWLLICKKKRENPIVIMDGDAFFKLLKKQNE